ncbi:MAG: thioredoxin family protein [Woeseiaceae bacterium]|nr:thioredoxin family protein [Woeseiaceae bacterium]
MISLGVLAGIASAAETDPDGNLFEPSADPLADVQRAVATAGLTQRRALVVLGANWCHDSRALAARLHRSPLKDVIERHYELVLVDVGFYEQGRAVTEEFGVPIYYATPTVLIIEPGNGQVVDDEGRHMWGNAYRVSMSESVEYFEKWANKRPAADPAENSSQLNRLYADIDKFERQLAERVAAGYAVVGPMLAAYKDGNAPADFDARWDELSDFRNAIPDDISALRDQAQRRVAAGEEDVQLLYPEYPALSWEPGD